MTDNEQVEVKRYPSCVRCGQKYETLGDLFPADDGFVCEHCFDYKTDSIDDEERRFFEEQERRFVEEEEEEIANEKAKSAD